MRRYEIGMQLSWYFARDKLRLITAMQALGELDAYLSLTELSMQEGYNRPEVLDGEAKIVIKDAHNPYIYSVRKEKSKPFTKIFEKGKTIAVITGPQEAGKSTFSNGVMLNMMLFQVGAWIPGHMQATPMVFHIAADPQGAQRVGMSHAKAQLCWGKQVLNMIDETHKDRGVPMLYIADEVFLGINSVEKIPVQCAYLAHLAAKPDLFVIYTTQDVDLCAAIEKLETQLEHVKNIHFHHFKGKDPETGEYPHILENGPVPITEMNAVDLMQELKYPAPITTLASQLAEEAIALAVSRDMLLTERINQAA